ncbi:MAG: hypothetical protein CM1200mP2_33480 [Planctomycetaceae bacterium]|nr:MAG: hypothetical protein CM1200mP2_33480 [Planctomycetaceae bacterium]
MSSAASLTTANRRPIPLQVRDDLIFERIEYLGISYWVVKDPVGLKYFRLQPEQYHALQLLNGDRHLEDSAMRSTTNCPPSASNSPTFST